MQDRDAHTIKEIVQLKARVAALEGLVRQLVELLGVAHLSRDTLRTEATQEQLAAGTEILLCLGHKPEDLTEERYDELRALWE